MFSTGDIDDECAEGRRFGKRRGTLGFALGNFLVFALFQIENNKQIELK